ncbi:MAG: nucleotidyltransferase domain-containing protein [Rhodocyclaceae bacterium]|nr:nucleotidyltransferase domain-containing protein [Rhodocyclaceae bacterium]
MNQKTLIQALQSRLPGLLAIYAFGSRVQGTSDAHSDLDLAILVAGHADPLLLWELAGDLTELAGCPVDLLDMRAASTVMQYQILITGQCWWEKDSRAALFAAAVLSDKTELDTARAELLADIQREGLVHGR